MVTDLEFIGQLSEINFLEFYFIQFDYAFTTFKGKNNSHRGFLKLTSLFTDSISPSVVACNNASFLDNCWDFSAAKKTDKYDLNLITYFRKETGFPTNVRLLVGRRATYREHITYNPFKANFPFLYPLKMFSEVSKGYRNEILAEND